MTIQPKLSIITICKNEARRVRLTCNSISNQSFKDFEWIVIDGGSTDGSYEILNEYRQHMAVFISEKDKGIYNAMNKGLKYVRGDYVMYLNAGDYLYNSGVLSKVFVDGTFKGDIIHAKVLSYINDNKKIIRDPDPVTKKYLLTRTIKHPASFVKRDILEKLKGFDESYKIAGDYDFFIRAVINQNATTEYVDEIITVFAMDGIARNNPALRKREQKLARRKNILKCTKINIELNSYLIRIIKLWKNKFGSFIKKIRDFHFKG